MTIKIEKGIPLPEVRKRQPKSPYDEAMKQMEVGDSFVCEGVKFNTVQGTLRRAAKKVGINVTVRRESEEDVSPVKLRVWRVADTKVGTCGE